MTGGAPLGATDELGYYAVDNIVQVHDLHATMLHLMGIDHESLTYRYQGRDFRLTDVAGKVVREVLVQPILDAHIHVLTASHTAPSRRA